MTAAAAALPLLPELGPPGWVALGVVGLGYGAYAGYRWYQSRSEQAQNGGEADKANEKADDKAAQGDQAQACSTCKPKDPCQGFRDQIAEHEQKLADYKADPYAHDNKGFLGQGRDAQIIAARIRSLEGQIENFKRQLEACEKANATS